MMIIKKNSSSQIVSENSSNKGNRKIIFLPRAVNTSIQPELSFNYKNDTVIDKFTIDPQLGYDSRFIWRPMPINITTSNLLIYHRLSMELRCKDNPDINFNDLTLGSAKKLIFYCKNQICGHHSWEAAIYSQTKKKSSACPFCAEQKLRVCICNSLFTLHPDLSETLITDSSFIKNWLIKYPREDKIIIDDIDPKKLNPFSNKKFLWRCIEHQCGEHIWVSSVNTRTFGTKCPFCYGSGVSKKVCYCFSLKSLYPDIAKMLITDPLIIKKYLQDNPEEKVDMIYDIDPGKMLPKTSKKFLWKCDKMNCDHHVFIATVQQQVNSVYNCFFCAHLRICPCNSLGGEYPDLTKELVSDQKEIDLWLQNNKTPHFVEIIDPYKIIALTARYCLWKCPNNSNHLWVACIRDRVKGSGCHFCNWIKIDEKESLLFLYPTVAAQIITNLEEIEYWKKQYPKHASKITMKIELNGISLKSNKFYFWKCQTQTCSHHVWPNSVYGRMCTECECPFCAGKRICECNSFANLYPELLKEMLPTDGFDPWKASYGSRSYVNWKCPTCYYTYNTKLFCRTTMRTGCPSCSSSKLEKEVIRCSKEQNLQYITEKTYEDCKNIKSLRFDFFYSKYNLLLEMDGMQHFKENNHFGGLKDFEQRKKNDKTKYDYCMTNRINFLRISCSEYENIKQILPEIIKIIENDPNKHIVSFIGKEYEDNPEIKSDIDDFE